MKFPHPLRVAPVISECIRELLREYVSEPFFLDLKEANHQAKLWAMLRHRLDPQTVRARIVPKGTRQLHVHEEFRTSRVQLELKVGNTERTDIIVFRADRLVTLTCDPCGPTGALANVFPEDVEAAIEIKATPSRKLECRQSFVEDIMKLFELQTRVPHIRCFFVLLDMSLSVPGAMSSMPPLESWRSELLERGFVKSFSPSLTFIEAWDLESGNPPIPRVEYWSKERPNNVLQPTGHAIDGSRASMLSPA